MDKIKIKETKFDFSIVPGWKRLNTEVSDKKLFAKYGNLDQMYAAIPLSEFNLMLKFNTLKNQDMIANFNLIQQKNGVAIKLKEKEIYLLNQEKNVYFQIKDNIKVLFNLESLKTIKNGFIINNNPSYFDELLMIEQLHNPQLTSIILHYQKSGYEVINPLTLTNK